jgi:hypothetical protein
MFLDVRTDGWLLMDSPFPTTVICLCYVYLVKSLGPKLMQNRQAFELKKAILIYNAIQVIFSSVIVYKVPKLTFTNRKWSLSILLWRRCDDLANNLFLIARSSTFSRSIVTQERDIFYFYFLMQALKHGWWFKYDLRCQPVDYSMDPEAVMAVHISYWYWASKFFEFFDTIFFVLRKKNDQITNLHVIHHGIMPAAVWWGVKFAPGGHGTFFGLLNSFVHVVMYSYYLLAAMGPKFQKYLWWKKHLTTLQMVQFATVFVHSSQALFNGCNYL